MKSFSEFKPRPAPVVRKTPAQVKLAEEVKKVIEPIPTPNAQTGDYISSLAEAIAKPNFSSITADVLNRLPIAEVAMPEPQLPSIVPQPKTSSDMSVQDIAKAISRPTGSLFALLEGEQPPKPPQPQQQVKKNFTEAVAKPTGLFSLLEADVADAQPATTFAPTKAGMVQQVKNALSEPKFSKNETPVPNLQKAELDGIRTSISNLMSRVNTLSIGGGGTGIVRIGMADDFDPLSYGEGKYLKWSRGAFRLDEINPFEIIHNTTEVTSNTYTIVDSDYYIGVNYNGVCNVTLPTDPASGRTVVIKDESGNAQLNPINILGTIDNDAGGATIKINNGAVQLLYRNGWRII